jgi:hypothetical protein
VWLGLYERETHSALRRLVRGCRGAIDLGAAKGDLTLWLLNQPGMQGVVAVEPLDRELAQFHENLSLNRRSSDHRLRVIHGFAGREEHTLDRLASGLCGPLFVKIDIDGPEADVLATGSGMLHSEDCRLLIETHSPEAEAGCIAQLAALGYCTEIINPAKWRVLLPEQRPLPHNRWLAAWRAAPAT